MKNICWWIWCACCFLWSGCAEENSMVQEPQLPDVQSEGLYSFKAGFAPSDGRTVLQEGGKVSWKAGDEVVLFDENYHARYVAVADGASTLFVVVKGERTLSTEGTYTAFYPADKFDVYKRTFEVKNVQTAEAGSFDPDAAICMARVQLNGTAQFRNICSLLKFRIPRNGVKYGIQAASLTGRHYKGIVSGGTVDAEGNITWNQYQKTFRLEGNFEYGKDYYLTVPAQVFSNGFDLELVNKNDEWIPMCRRQKKSSFEAIASKLYDLGMVFDPVSNTSWYTEAIQADPEATEFVISTPYEWVGLVDILQNGITIDNVTQSEDFDGKTVSLKTSIDMDDLTEGLSMLENFAGTFDGKGYTVRNLHVVSEASIVGVFSSLQAGVSVKNLTLENGSVTSRGTDSSVNYQVGGLAGSAQGVDFENCHIRNFQVSHAGHGAVAGLVGWASDDCRFVACSHAGTVSSTSTSGQSVYMGGITNCGGSDTEMVACYNVGTFDCGTAQGFIGGIAGNYSGSNRMYGCYHLGEISGTVHVGGLVGLGTGNNSTLYHSYFDGMREAVGLNKGVVLTDVSKMDYQEAVSSLNDGIEFYNRSAVVPCNYRFVTTQSPVLQLKESNSPMWDSEEY